MSSTTQQFAIDLERNEDLARIVADAEPGETLEATLRIVAKNDKTLTVELVEVEEEVGAAEEADEEAKDKPADEDKDEDMGDSPAMKVMTGNG